MKTFTKRFLALTVIAVMLLGAASCSSERSASARVEAHNEAIEAPAAAAEEVRSMDYAVNDGFYTEGATEDAYYYEENASVSQGSSGSGSSTEPVTQSGQTVTERMLIRNVSVQCETLNFPELTNSIEAQVAALGGYIESKSFYGTGNAGDLRTASYTIRVTSEALDQLVSTIGNTALITGSNESTEDVTLSYTDMQARVESLRIEQDTLNELLAQADSLETILILQDELTSIRYQIESYESQMRVLENLSSYSTLNLTISEVIEETVVEEARVKTYSEKISEAWHDGLDEAKEWFQDLGLYLAENAIGIGVKIILLVVAVVVVRIVIKKRKKKAASKKAVSVPAPAHAPAQITEVKNEEQKKD